MSETDGEKIGIEDVRVKFVTSHDFQVSVDQIMYAIHKLQNSIDAQINIKNIILRRYKEPDLLLQIMNIYPSPGGLVIIVR